MNAVSEILLFEGLPPRRRGGRSVFGKSCIRNKRVYSPRLGRNVIRCAEFSGGGTSLGSLGALPISLEQIKSTALTGAVACGGAVVANKAMAYFAPMIKLDPLNPKDQKWIGALEVLTGIGLGYGIGKFARQPDLGAAVAVGPIMFNGLKVLGYLITPPIKKEKEEAVSGYYPPAVPAGDLGVTIPQDQWPPAWMYESPYLDQARQQAPAWAM